MPSLSSLSTFVYLLSQQNIHAILSLSLDEKLFSICREDVSSVSFLAELLASIKILAV